MLAVLLVPLLLLLGVRAQDLGTNRIASTPSFAVDYENDRFLLDGKPFRYISGSIHYFRVHPEQWRDRLQRIRALGLNAIQFYIPWNFHEFDEGDYDFSGWKDVVKFIKIAEELGLYSLVRLGPYSCGEWENGGLPWWLLHTPDIKQRTVDPRFLNATAKWFNVLLPRLKPLLRENGGPVLMVQIENEYGSYYACDRNYTIFLRDLTRQLLGDKVVIYTTDGNADYFLKCGAVPDVFPTVDFGVTSKQGVNNSFAAQRQYLPNGRGPLVNSEFYPGWLVLWGQTNGDGTRPAGIVSTSQAMWDFGASFNFYMIYGGTNFGFWNGAESTMPVITSYDYFAPISESGDINPMKYLGIRDFISELPGWKNKPQPVPADSKKVRPFNVSVVLVPGSVVGAVLQDLKSACVSSDEPKTFEELNHGVGLVLYRHRLKKSGSQLNMKFFKDFAYVSINGAPEAFLYTNLNKTNLTTATLNSAKTGSTLEIVVENRGRQTYETINDFKGILDSVLLDNETLTQWDNCPLRLPLISKKLGKGKTIQKIYALRHYNDPSPLNLYVGTFTLDEAADAWIDTRGWRKGILIVNGFNLGRYWTDLGPQLTLYVPAPVLRKGENSVLILELRGVQQPCKDKTCVLSFTDKPIFDLKEENSVPQWASRRPHGHSF